MKWIVLTAASGALAAVAFSQNPPFPSSYSYSSGSRFVRSDYMLDANAGTNIYWNSGQPFNGQGLRLRINVQNPPPTSMQHRRSFTPSSGLTARAKMRVRLDHVNDDEGKFGFYSERPNPFVGHGSGSEPDYAAYFYQKLGWTELNGCPKAHIYARVNNNSPCDTEQYLFTYVENRDDCNPDGDVYDMIVEVNGTTNVKFYWKRANETTFSSYTAESDIPTGAMHYSAARRCVHGSNGYMELRAFQWEIVED
jgi:hypothetical protein